ASAGRTTRRASRRDPRSAARSSGGADIMTELSGPRFVTLPEIRRAAQQRLPREAWNVGDGGAETERTLRRNRRHLDRLAIQQNVLVDVRAIDLRTSLLGVPLAWPVAVAPMGGLVLFHPEGDVEMARCAGRA